MGKTHPIVNKKADSKLIIFINKKSAFRRFLNSLTIIDICRSRFQHHIERLFSH